MAIAKLEQYGLLQVTGEDARAFLHAQLTNDIESLPPGKARYAGWCSAQGRLLATFLVVPFGEGFLLQLARDLAAPVAKRLSMFVLRSKVKLADVSSQWMQYGVWGSGGDLSVRIEDGQVKIGIDAGRTLVLTEKSMQSEKPAEEWTLAEIGAGRPLVTQATQDRFVPQMLNLELSGGVDFRKGCYPGQEIVARAQYRGAVKRRMVRLRGARLQPGQELYSDDHAGQASGTVVNAAGDEALAVVQVATIESRSPIRVQPQGTVLETATLPYAQ
jgi:folate-binding protein YgfZ